MSLTIISIGLLNGLLSLILVLLVLHQQDLLKNNWLQMQLKHLDVSLILMLGGLALLILDLKLRTSP